MKTLPGIVACGLFVLSLSAWAERDTMYVDDGHIYTAAGESLVMRGFNEMFVWSGDPTGERLIPEIDQSGANALRLVWDHKVGEMAALIELIDRTIEHKMVAIPECHNATGKWGDELKACLNFWLNDVLVAAIERQKRWSIVNIANEAGDHSITDEQFVDFYSRAISELREWGYTVPIMIDAAGWGQNVDQLLRVAPRLLASDPLENVIFSTHSYWPHEQSMDNYRKVAVTAKEKRVAMIIGEGPSVTRVGQCDNPKPLPYLQGMQLLQEQPTGWLNWSWGGMKNGDCDDYRYFDITKDGEFGQWWHTPGADIVALSPASVMQTSKRPRSFYGDGKVQASGIYLHVSSAEIRVGESTSYKVIIAPANTYDAEANVTVEGDKSVVELDSDSRRLTGLAPGRVTIRATAAGGDLQWQTDLTVR